MQLFPPQNVLYSRDQKELQATGVSHLRIPYNLEHIRYPTFQNVPFDYGNEDRRALLSE